jgi:hypothetical protein
MRKSHVASTTQNKTHPVRLVASKTFRPATCCGGQLNLGTNVASSYCQPNNWRTNIWAPTVTVPGVSRDLKRKPTCTPQKAHQTDLPEYAETNVPWYTQAVHVGLSLATRNATGTLDRGLPTRRFWVRYLVHRTGLLGTGWVSAGLRGVSDLVHRKFPVRPPMCRRRARPGLALPDAVPEVPPPSRTPLSGGPCCRF